MPSLFVIRGADQGMRFEVETGRVTIGREASNSIQLHDREVSRHHAEIHGEGERLVLLDLGSSNGTYVNGERIKTHELASGDQVQIGRTLMLFTGPAEESSSRLQEKVGIVEQPPADDKSRIVRSMGHEEGSQLLQIMYRTALAVSHTLDIDLLLKRIMEMIFDWVDADHGCIMLLDPDSEELRPKVHLSREAKGAKLEISRSILDHVIKHDKGVLTSNAQQDDRFNPGASILKLGIREAICVPMQGRYDMVGVIYIDTTTSPQSIVRMGGAVNKFNEDHLKLMIAIGHQAALAVEDTRYYSAMVQAERMAAIGQTITTLSHHIKNILQGVRASSFLIEDGLQRHDENMIRQGWEFVLRNQQRISDLVMDMLTFSKDREPEMLPADLGAVVEEVVDLMQRRAADVGVQIRFEPDRSMPKLTFDAEGLHRAVLNVVSNAIDACERLPEALVTISTQFCPDEELARIVIQDNGCGIEAEMLEKMFTLFVSTKSSRGTGLGLPVSQKIMQEHGGEILVESEPDQGSRFTLEFPAILSDGGDPSRTIA